MEIQIIGNIFIAGGAAATVICAVYFVVRVFMFRKFYRTTGEIISLNKGEMKLSSKFPMNTETPVLRYAADGKIIESACLPPSLEGTGIYLIGQTIDILYNPSKPQKHYNANSFRTRHFGSISGIVLGLCFIGIGIYFRTLTI